MKRTLVLIIALVAVGTVAVGSAAAGNGKGNGGNSANAKLCQKGGWQSLFTSNGLPFASEEDCVSYAAQGGVLSTTGFSCSVTATSGCLTFDNVTLASVDPTGYTVTLNGAWSFNTSCNFADPTTTCPTSSLNNYATGGGTYVVKDSTGAVVEQGTITTADTPGAAYEGLGDAFYVAADGTTPTSCSAAAIRAVGVYGSSSVANDPSVFLAAQTDVSQPGAIGLFVTLSGVTFEDEAVSSGITLTC